MVDGEKDPRNLLLLFSMDRVILLEFEIESHIEVRVRLGDRISPIDKKQEFFDITFCYFPIAFRPPPNDPYGITADDLKIALRGCMSASPHFAKMAIPLFLEKFATATGLSMVSFCWGVSMWYLLVVERPDVINGSVLSCLWSRCRA